MPKKQKNTHHEEPQKNREADLDGWRGSIPARSGRADTIIQAVLNPDRYWGGSGVFMARDEAGQRWWVKPPNQLQGGRVLVTEHVVGRVGTLIGAPVPPVAIVCVPDSLRGTPLLSGATLLESGLGHGSCSVGDVDEEYSLIDRHRDDNARRHAGIFALYDLCWGADGQWLYEQTEDRRVFSHDHGWFLPGGPHWNEQSLLEHVDEAHPLQKSSDGLDAEEIERLAGRLEQLTRTEIASILAGVPAAWPIRDRDLETLGYFLARRAPAVAKRLRELPI